MFCMNCGYKLPDGVNFCPNCGTKIQTVMPANTAVSEPQPTEKTPQEKAQEFTDNLQSKVSQVAGDISSKMPTADEAAAAIGAKAEALKTSVGDMTVRFRRSLAEAISPDTKDQPAQVESEQQIQPTVVMDAQLTQPEQPQAQFQEQQPVQFSEQTVVQQPEQFQEQPPVQQTESYPEQSTEPFDQMPEQPLEQPEASSDGPQAMDKNIRQKINDKVVDTLGSKISGRGVETIRVSMEDMLNLIKKDFLDQASTDEEFDEIQKTVNGSRIASFKQLASKDGQYLMSVSIVMSAGGTVDILNPGDSNWIRVVENSTGKVYQYSSFTWGKFKKAAKEVIDEARMRTAN